MLRYEVSINYKEDNFMDLYRRLINIYKDLKLKNSAFGFFVELRIFFEFEEISDVERFKNAIGNLENKVKVIDWSQRFSQSSAT